MADTIKKKLPNAKVKLIEGSGGAFEIRKDGSMLFSKLKKGRFPEHDEIIDLLK